MTDAPEWFVLRCCRDWPVDWNSMARDLCPVCGMRRRFVDVRYDDPRRER